ncbi:PD-(D/E)XK nuclease family protein [candidate division TA06 bacterium]|uniref:PD-(D/E)XK nuclease family protein n=1 Tax=candidate division TA06 bacterium TaxID=2250710 RepID=A0A933MK52_UNCT6|nr:PD-(D/E)XK nuclease family protein [candidate division TA06 bacterium]
MSRSYLLPKGSDLVARICRMIPKDQADLSQTMVVFPGRRPSHFLLRALFRQDRIRPFLAPRLFSIDDWVDWAALELGQSASPLLAADGVALLFKLHQDLRLPGDQGDPLSFEEFMAWGFKLLGDLEELRLERVSKEQLKGVQALAGESWPARFQQMLPHLAEWYEGFYRELESQKFSTRANSYFLAASNIERLDLSSFKTVILAGFYALTGCEQEIFKNLVKRDNVTLVLRDGPGIGRIISQLKVFPEKAGREQASPKVSFYRATDSHGQVMGLKPLLDQAGEKLDDAVLVLPRPDTVFPLIHHILPGLSVPWNISLGYPLERTPLYGLMQSLAKAQESRDQSGYFLPDYLRLMLHPYVKNLALGKASFPSRILLQALEQVLNERGRRLVTLEEIENDPEIRIKLEQKLQGLSDQGWNLEELFAHLAGLHRLLLLPLEQPDTVAAFALNLLTVVSRIAENSPAGRHPYAAKFFMSMTGCLEQLQNSLLAGQSFTETKIYFGLLDGFVRQARVPFPGTPLNGLQALGFLETRDLAFERVLVLDANDGILPEGRMPDAILPQALRTQLGLPGSAQRELISRYHFENLIFGAKEVSLFYSHGGGAQRSRFLEQLVWERQKAEGRLSAGGDRLLKYAESFTQQDPPQVSKTPAMMEAVSRLSFSASMLDSYLGCGLKFYHHYLLAIRELDQVGGDIEARQIGTTVHRVLKIFFEGRPDGPFAPQPRDFARMDAVVDQVIRELHGDVLDGGMCLVASQIKARMAQLLQHHREMKPAPEVLGRELKLEGTVDILPGLQAVPVNGTLDRIDRRGGRLVIVDYKTGGSAKVPSFKNFDLDRRQGWAKALGSVQLPFYLMLYCAFTPEADPKAVDSELLLLGGKAIKTQPLFKDLETRDKNYQDCLEAIARLVSEIRDPGLPFTGTQDTQNQCRHCDFKVMCGRQWVPAQ